LRQSFVGRCQLAALGKVLLEIAEERRLRGD
jgi:hypothetical protein